MAYATYADLQAWVLGSQVVPVKAEAERLLERASLEVRGATKTAVYVTDNDGNATDPGVVAALRDAACATVESWLETGDELRAAAEWSRVSLGPATLDRGGGRGGGGGGGPRGLPERAHRILLDAGLAGGGGFIAS